MLLVKLTSIMLFDEDYVGYKPNHAYMCLIYIHLNTFFSIIILV